MSSQGCMPVGVQAIEAERLAWAGALAGAEARGAASDGALAGASAGASLPETLEIQASQDLPLLTLTLGY